MIFIDIGKQLRQHIKELTLKTYDQHNQIVDQEAIIASLTKQRDTAHQNAARLKEEVCKAHDRIRELELEVSRLANLCAAWESRHHELERRDRDKDANKA